MTRSESPPKEESTLDQKVKLSLRDWLFLGAMFLAAIAAFFDLRSQVRAMSAAASEINTRQDREIGNLQTDVRELRARR